MPPNPRGPVPGVIRHILVIKARKSINPQLRMAQLDKLSAVDLKIKKICSKTYIDEPKHSADIVRADITNRSVWGPSLEVVKISFRQFRACT